MSSTNIYLCINLLLFVIYNAFIQGRFKWIQIQIKFKVCNTSDYNTGVVFFNSLQSMLSLFTFTPIFDVTINVKKDGELFLKPARLSLKEQFGVSSSCSRMVRL